VSDPEISEPDYFILGVIVTIILGFIGAVFSGALVHLGYGLPHVGSNVESWLAAVAEMCAVLIGIVVGVYLVYVLFVAIGRATESAIDQIGTWLQTGDQR